MSLEFKNSYRDTIWIAFAYHDTTCGGTPWRKMGWWQVLSGQTFNAWNTDLQSVNRYAAFYAEEFKGSGGATWSGTGNNWYLISDSQFDQCYDDNTNCNQQPDFVLLDFGGIGISGQVSTMQVELGPSAGQVTLHKFVPID
jgi:uncharacterized membrane protein